MFKYALVLVVAACWCVVGCGSPTAPCSVEDCGDRAKMQVWADAHSGELCVSVTHYDSVTNQYVNVPTLMPKSEATNVPSSSILPISACNPAE